MTIKPRYFKATDGICTVFRSTQTRVYKSAWIELAQLPGDVFRVRNFGFSAANPIIPGRYPAVEIDKDEYLFLVQLKGDRIKAAGGKGAHSPSHSWVRNGDLNPTIMARIVGLNEEEGVSQ